MNHRIRRYETCDSTNERALCALDKGTGQHGDVLIAKEQSQGRGRQGSVWWSAPAGGLYLSMIWRPKQAINAVCLTLAGGLAALDCAQLSGLDRCLLKWPNDLMVGDKKLAGVLVETRGLEPSQPRYVIGIGLNVGQESFPTDLQQEREVTSLAQEGIDSCLAEAEEHLIKALDQRLEQAARTPSSLGEDFLTASQWAGARVEGQAGNQVHRGRVLKLEFEFDLDSEPALCLETAPGVVTRLVAAHISALHSR